MAPAVSKRSSLSTYAEMCSFWVDVRLDTRQTRVHDRPVSTVYVKETCIDGQSASHKQQDRSATSKESTWDIRHFRSTAASSSSATATTLRLHAPQLLCQSCEEFGSCLVHAAVS